jgi:hypothetical protein
MADDLRASRLGAFDAYSRDFMVRAAATYGSDGGLARGDVEALAALADQVVRSLALWRDRVDALDVAARRRLSVPGAARAVTEAVFDDVLEPEATRVFAAAIDLAL